MRRLALLALLAACRQLDVPAGSAPVIAAFSAQPASAVSGDAVALSWQVTGAQSLSIDNGVGAVSGASVTVHPTADTLYTLTARSGQWIATATAAVQVAAHGAAAASFRVEPDTATPAAGAAFQVKVTALDAAGAAAPLYRGTVHLLLDDAAATPPAPVAFTQQDSGAHSFAVTLFTAGDHTITASDGAATGAATVHLGAGVAGALALTGAPATTVAGSSFSLTLTATDAHGNRAGGYRGTVHFTSTDPAATLPADYAFTAGDAGEHAFTVALATAGPQTVTAADGALSASTPTVLVGPAVADHVAFSALPAQAVAGTGLSTTATVLDASGNVVTGYAGTLHFTSSDAHAVLPADYSFTVGDAGAHAFAVTFDTAGSQTAAAGDGAIGGATTAVQVTAAAPKAIALSMPASGTAGVSFSATATVVDAFLNVVTTYAGTVHFSSADTHAALPADYGFGAADLGTHQFTLALGTAGTQMVAVADTASSSISGSASTSVAAGPAKTLSVTGLAAFSQVGAAQGFTVTALDQFGNTATSYAGTVHFTSSDGAASLPADSGVASGSQGFSATFNTVGAQTVTATDTAASTITGTSAACSVSAGGPAQIALALPATATAGVPFAATATVQDGLGNTVTTYAGTVHFSSGDAKAALPADYTYQPADNGVRQFSIALGTSGAQSVHVADTVSSGVAGSGSVAVSPGPAVSLSLTGLATSSTAGAAQGFTVTALDSKGNVATAYAGTVHFTSTDGAAVKPADATLTSGAGTFSVTFKTAGAQTVTATDTATASITGTSGACAVSAAAAATCAMSGVPASTAINTTFSPAVALHDAFGNLATGYRGTLTFSSSDGAATKPANYTYTAGDAGAHTFTGGASFATAGSQTLTATDTAQSALTCGATSSVSAVTTDHYAFSGLPASASAGAPVSFTVTVQTPANATDAAYRGTVVFSSSDTAAALPASYTFTAGDAGVHAFTGGVTFATPGAQTITGTDSATAAITGTSSPVTVHGFVYTDPAAGVGKIRLVKNAASTGAVAVLDLVAAASLTGYFVGLDLPVDSTKVALGAPAIAAGTALNPGLAPLAMAAALPASGPLASMLVSGLSQKAAGAGAVTGDASIASGQVFYRLQLDLASGAASGTVFDGASLPASFRASLRTRASAETAALTDFAIGKLVVQ